MLMIDGVIYSMLQHGGIHVCFRHLVRYLSKNVEEATMLIEDVSMQDIEAAKNPVYIVHRVARLLEHYRHRRVHHDSSVSLTDYYRQPKQHDLSKYNMLIHHCR